MTVACPALPPDAERIEKPPTSVPPLAPPVVPTPCPMANFPLDHSILSHHVRSEEIPFDAWSICEIKEVLW